MIDILQVALLGGVVGIIAGIVPGVGMLVAIALMYPILLDFQPVELLIFYTSMVCSAQYFGSITAIYLGLAGEASSFPAVIEGYSLSKQGRGQESIFLTGIGSFIGTMVGLLVILALSIPALELHLTSFQKMSIFMAVGFSLILTTKNSFFLDICLIILAIGLSHIGMTMNSNVPMTHFNIEYLSHGISYFTLAAGLLCMKEVLHVEQTKTRIIVKEKYNALKTFIEHKYAIIRGSLFGSIGGMFPGLTTISASHLAYVAEKKIRQDTYKKGDSYCLTSSETANNSGSITQLFPLLMFGIPITGSEAILFQMLEMKGWEGSATQPLVLLANNWWVLLGINLVMLVLAIRFAKHFIKLIPKNSTVLKVSIFVLLSFVVYFVGEDLTSYGFFNMFLFWFVTLIAWKFPKVDYLPFIFWMCIGDIWLGNFYAFLQIYEII